MVRRRALMVGFAAGAAMALLFASTLAVADGTDSDGDGVPDATEIETQRSVATAVAGDEMNISSRLVSAPLEDQFQVSFKAGTFDVSYNRPGGGSSGYELELRNLVEWVDTNRDGRLNGTEIVNATSLGTAAFADVRILHNETTEADGGRVFHFLIPSRTGEVTLALTVAQRFVRYSSTRVLTPMEVKMDITVNHTMIHAGASLGIEMRMNTFDRFEYGPVSWDDEHGFATDEGAVNVTRGPADGSATVFFSWANTAVANGLQIPVNVSSFPREPGSYEVYLAYPLGASSAASSVLVVHDPTLGVESSVYQQILQKPAPPRGDSTLYAISLAGMGALVGASIVFAKRRRKREQ